ncbi:pilus assembly protein [Undibacterium pigrum]|uniref:Type IV pilus assembly protein PilY1 n=1 Tax=Undibacterium pigrum TaxID=401470 RepID=A0A318IV54_9BURK|nr:PilC/PilY family type IV pilus protein [Undibacterium pigrum]PXX40056.1 type IV pilus assembly protein PilY1 [Undibacterium pigrum]
MTNNLRKPISYYLICALAAQFGWSASAYAGISQMPPLVKPNVPPNIFYTLDDSGSMMFEMLPDNIARTGNNDTSGTAYNNYCTSGDDCWVTSVFPRPANIYNISGDYNQDNRVVVGFNHNITVARWRSSDVNKAYYDPKVLYVPWAKPGGGQMDPANPAAALLNPVAPNGGTNTTTMNLTQNQTFAAGYAAWLNDAANAYDTNARTIFPALYYIYNPGGSCNKSTLSCYTRVEIKAGTSLPPKAPARTDCTAATCTIAQEQQNFANWFQYYRSRILAARAGTGLAFAKQSATLRVGFGTINTTGTVINRVSDDFTDPNKTAFLNTLYKHRMPASSTPLRKAIDEVGQYFRNRTVNGPWQTQYGIGATTTQLTCRQNYNILMTDGYWNDAAAGGGRTLNYDGTAGPTITGPNATTYTYNPANPVGPYADTFANTLADIAFYYWSRDLRDDWGPEKKNVPVSGADPAFWQHLVHFTVGLGVAGNLNYPGDLPALTAGTKQWPDGASNQIDDLWHAAVNSRGKFFSASNPTEFSAALESSLNTISERIGDAAAVGTSSNTVRSGTSLYTSSYRTSDWSGQIVQRPLDVNGNLTTAGWVGSVPAFSTRKDKVFTYVDATAKGRKFDLLNLAVADQAYFNTEALTYLPANSVTGANIVDYIKGGPDLGGILRPRTQAFGDFVNSAPQYLKEGEDDGYDFLPSTAPEKANSYTDFLTFKAGRPSMVYIGANDGMLHALDGATGIENFAYVPKGVMSKLPELSRTTYGHKFYVDGTPTLGDYWNSGWKTALVGTTGAGGRSVFALDVTNPTSFAQNNVLWEITSADDADLGYTIGNAQIGRMPNGDWVAVVGNGYESGNKHAVLFLIRLKDGQVTKIDTGVGNAVTPNGLSSPTLLFNVDSTIKAIYAGDIQGNLWKFNVTSSGTSVAFSGVPLFRAVRSTKTQPITVPPDITPHPRGGMLILFGTGKVYETDDALNTDVQSIYGVWDNTGVASVTASAITGSQTALQKQTLTATGSSYTVDNKPMDYSAKRGWYMDLDTTLSTGERITIEPQVYFDEVIFTSIIPAGATDTCSSDGKSTTFILRALTGGVFPYPVFDTNGDGKVDSSDTLIAGKQGTLTFGTTILKKGNKSIIYQPPSSGSTDANGPKPVQTTFSQGDVPATRVWKQLLRTD